MSASGPHSGPQEVVYVRLEPLLETADELAKRWLIALLQGRPLERAAEIPLEHFAREAPALCANVLLALQSDAQLAQARASVADLADLVAAADAAELVEAIEALRSTLWRALSEALPGLGAGETGRLADRLAHICSLLIASSLAQPRRAVEAPVARRGREPAAPPAPAASNVPSAPAGGESSAQAPVPEGPGAEGPEAADEENDRAPRIEMQHLRAPGGEGSELDDPWAFDAEDTSQDPGPPSDVASEIERHSGDGERFVVLLIEVVDFERLREAEDASAIDELLAHVQRALSDALGPADRLAAEGPARWWLVARGALASEGRSLAELLARGVSAAVAHRRVALKVAIGVAASPEDGLDAAGLAEHAEEELYAARAAGLSVLPASSAPTAAPVSDG